jgi:NADH:ubiquinone oxidoreductase subunit E
MRPERRSGISNAVELGKVDAIIDNYASDRSCLIAILQDAQDEYGYLPEAVLKHIAEKFNAPLIQVFGVATFFKAFRLTPRGEHTVRVCLGTACHVRGAPSLLEEVERKLKVDVGGTTDDGMFTLETVNCLGCCALGPVTVIDDEYFGQMSSTKVGSLLRKYSKSGEGH